MPKITYLALAIVLLCGLPLRAQAKSSFSILYSNNVEGETEPCG